MERQRKTASTHTCLCLVPRGWERLLHSHRWLAAYFCRLNCDATPLEREQADAALAQLPQGVAQVPVVLPRLLFLQTLTRGEGAKAVEEYMNASPRKRAAVVGRAVRIGAYLCPVRGGTQGEGDALGQSLRGNEVGVTGRGDIEVLRVFGASVA